MGEKVPGFAKGIPIKQTYKTTTVGCVPVEVPVCELVSFTSEHVVGGPALEHMLRPKLLFKDQTGS